MNSKTKNRAQSQSFDNSQDQDVDFVSKSELKRASEALQKLGLKLVNLPAAKLAKVPVPDELMDAIELAHRLEKKHEAKRRHMQYIGKLMRNIDVEPIEQAMFELENEHNLANARFHALEQQRDAIVKDGNSAIEALMAEHPDLDRQRLRNWARQASKEAAANKPPKASREIFKYLREQLLDSE
ncbi:ribosome biogenesis factor YjgA [Paraferrimonas sedimenticola]|uniref:Dual-action ribosomal maturation protein DarP n=1 Tax=Paraferrimonas sedimenticola TaxID=375674 RepID=A0AA37RUX7_9GAMM|nr:ribosome biogenesis factor YjgA [Paraferrimonas sedimenticola]GLP95839.1 UPF0307 protein [Paraferrimonas sedimenticola]